MSAYFYTENINGQNIKFRLMHRGKTPQREDWYDFECRNIDVPNSRWEGGLSGTEEYLRGIGIMTNQDKEWAKRN